MKNLFTITINLHINLLASTCRHCASVCATETEMSNNSILNYFTSQSSLPNPKTPSRSLPSSAIVAANTEVTRMMRNEQEKTTKRKPYNKYTAAQRAAIGKYTAENGVVGARRHFKTYNWDIHEATLRNFKKKYIEEKKRKRLTEEEDDVLELSCKRRGRKLLLGDRLDNMVQEYIRRIRDSAGIINTAIVVSSARGILLSQDRTRLAEFGGPATLTIPWAKSLLKRMHFSKRRGTTKASLPPDVFQQKKTTFLQDIIDVVTMEEIPQELILNWDQTGLNLVPVSSWTMDKLNRLKLL